MRTNHTSDTTNVTRRSVLRTGVLVSSAAIVGGAGLVGRSGARPGRGGGNLVSAVASHGHYAAFPKGPATWKRSTNPYSGQDDDARWLAEPASGGSIRCLVENVPSQRNAGVDVHVGPLGEVESVTVDAGTVQTADGESASYFLGLYLDVDDDGEFFAWTDDKGNTDVWDGFGADAEGVVFPSADGPYTVDDDTAFVLFHVGEGPNPATLEQLKDGAVSGADGTTIDGGTNAAIYVGVIGGETSGTEEIVVDSVDVSRS
jgi:hypothetical protein